MLEKNDLEAFKQNIKKFVNKYNIKNIYVEIEEMETTECEMGKESNSYKDITISIEY